MRNSNPIVLTIALMGFIFWGQGCLDQDVDEGGSPGPAGVTVVFQGQNIVIELSDAEQTSIEDESYALLLSVVSLALPDEDVTELEYDFVASDGFSPLNGANCDDMIPLSGEYLDKGFVNVKTRELFWAAEADFPTCMNVKGLAKIMVAAGEEAVSVSVIFEEQTINVALEDADQTAIENETYALLDSVVGLALPDEDITKLEYDFEASDGYTPLDGAYCSDLIPLPGDDLDKGFIHLSSRNLIWAEEAGFPGCMKVKDLEKITVSTGE